MGEDQEDRPRTGADKRPPGDKAAQVPRARKRTRQADAERARLAAIVASSFDAIIGTDLGGTITNWNAAAEKMLGYTPDEAVGRHISLIVPDSRRVELEGIFARLKRGEQVPPFETVRRRKDGAELAVSLTVSPILGSDGTITGAAGIARDITERKRAEEERERLVAALRENEERMRLAFAAGKASYWSWETGTDALTLSRPTSRRLGLPPHAAITGAAFTDRFIHPDDRERARRDFRRAVGGAAHLDGEYRLLLPDGVTRWYAARGRRVEGPSGGLRRMAGVLIDITERKHAEEQQALLIQELNHRVKNALALVQAMFQQSQRTSQSAGAFAAAFTGRLGAMASAHNLLTQNRWQGSALEDVAGQVLEPYMLPGRIAILGKGRVMLTPQAAVTLAMVLHELATNAAKHGALSVARGRVELTWTVEAADTGPVLDLRWRETGGAEVRPPTRRGFGCRLIERAVEYELGGTAELSFAPGGVRCRLRSPLTPIVGSRAP